ncbi:MAG: hypothetical protein FJ197_09655 [Gammaproteobacteria bacterium]|nr:hypothetical protein [Gammaproteobacteria bacterium]
MGELRWVLLGAGILVLLGVFLWSQRQKSAGSAGSPIPFGRREPKPGTTVTGAVVDSVATRSAEGSQPHKIIAVRLTAPASGTFAGDLLQAALTDAGLRHGLYGIFHRHDPADDRVIRFSVASLVEPGRFDLARFATDRFPGVSLFLPVAPGVDNVAVFDEMMSTARKMAARLEGELLDERGSRLSVQRERYLREEVIQQTRQFATAS